jgi:LmbE family N-acetylglucosaminyl deacetylase
MKILIVAAHPDDEMFGAGGTILKHKDAGDELFIHFLTDGHSSRIEDSLSDKYSNPQLQKRLASARKVASALEVSDILIDEFDDQMLDTYPLIKITKSIEKFSKDIKPDLIYTHYAHDVNKDHQITFSAVLNAFRMVTEYSPQRIISMEVPSSSEWGFPAFTPNYFVDVTKFIEEKIRLIEYYNDEIKISPHPRSIEKIKCNAKKWGASIFCDSAEAFCIVRQVWK